MKTLLTVQQIKKIFQIHEETVYRWLKKGIIYGVKRGKRWYFDPTLLTNIPPTKK